MQTDNSFLILVSWKYSEIVYEKDDEHLTDVVLNSDDEVRSYLNKKLGILVDK